jgi:hypothetical protein
VRGLAEVDRRHKKLLAVFASIDGQDLPPEVLSHYARYLCVLVAGFAEQSTKELLSEFARNQSSARVHRYVANQLKLIWGLDVVKLQRLVEAIDPAWWEDLKDNHPEELDALASVAGLRNQIAHGGDAGVTISTMRTYADHINRLMRSLSRTLGDPTDQQFA